MSQRLLMVPREGLAVVFDPYALSTSLSLFRASFSVASVARSTYVVARLHTPLAYGLAFAFCLPEDVPISEEGRREREYVRFLALVARMARIFVDYDPLRLRTRRLRCCSHSMIVDHCQ